ncbi:MAG: acyl carrier protein [Bacteroidetes bacterium]|nr:acyl carrier protein [Bacteroidota bacterium]
MKLNTILKESFNAKESEMMDETRLMSFSEWDSMAHMFFITRLEEDYAIELTGDEIAAMQTVGDIKKVIISKGKEV